MLELPPSIQVNGMARPYREITLAELLRELGMDPSRSGLAVAVGDEVVPRGEWVRRLIRPGDSVEVVGATQGG